MGAVYALPDRLQGAAQAGGKKAVAAVSGQGGKSPIALGHDFCLLRQVRNGRFKIKGAAAGKKTFHHLHVFFRLK